ncbi:phosphotransferase [Actinopolymorpha sp. B9G3]|uniref:phosphotransferase family protein n=1 Tax=Actinopolymorpha sp. B9G3 TaxID=3158970 RepID=UPI0032D9A685
MSENATAKPATTEHHTLVAEINKRTGLGVVVTGMADQGETGGAVFVRWPDGHDGVVTRAYDAGLHTMRRTAEVLSMLRGQGLPVPRHELVVQLDNGVVGVVQERLPGTPPHRTDADMINAVLAMNERFAGQLTSRPDVPVPPLHLRHSGPEFPRHETLAGYNDRSRRLLKIIREVGAAPVHEMTGDDLVHTDYTIPNVLIDDSGKITGVVDWNFGVARGDRHFGLIKLRFDLAWARLDPTGGHNGVQQEAIDHLDNYLDATLEPDLLRMYWAHWTLTMLHWTIRAGEPDVIDLHLRLGESRLS